MSRGGNFIIDMVMDELTECQKISCMILTPDIVSKSNSENALHKILCQAPMFTARPAETAIPPLTIEGKLYGVLRFEKESSVS